MPGLIGRALGGAGAALEKSGLMALESALMEQRQSRLMELSQKFQTEQQQRGFEHTESLQRGQQDFQRGLQSEGFLHTETMADARRDFEREQNEAQRGLTREQIASHEKIAQLNRKNAVQISQMGGTVQQDKDGRILFIDRSGNAKPIIDPQTNQPLIGHKDLTPAAKAYADAVSAQLKNLDTLEASPMSDDATRAQIGQRRVQLNTELLNVLTQGIGKAGETTKPNVPQAAIDALKKNPNLADQFRAKYKVDPAQFLQGSPGQPSKGLIRRAGVDEE